jgi:hypothetical protein
MLKLLLFGWILLSSLISYAQQVADTLYNPPIHHPAYDQAKGSIIIIDEAHFNFHTISGRFKPFARLLQRDGYVVKGSARNFTSESLNECKILVIANALHPSNEQQWALPTPSAFTDEEIAALNEWVKNGGALLLIADHMPFPGAAEKLALSFGFTFYNGFAMRKGMGGKDIFKPEDGLLETTLTKGRNQGERVTSLQTFTGQAFKIPQDAVPVVVLDKHYQILLPKTAWDFKKDTEKMSAENLAQGAYMRFGEGRVVIFGEAAMFTAQVQGGKTKMGMNESSASQNFQFVLNTIHWLDGLLSN